MVGVHPVCPTNSPDNLQRGRWGEVETAVLGLSGASSVFQGWQCRRETQSLPLLEPDSQHLSCQEWWQCLSSIPQEEGHLVPFSLAWSTLSLPLPASPGHGRQWLLQGLKLSVRGVQCHLLQDVFPGCPTSRSLTMAAGRLPNQGTSAEPDHSSICLPSSLTHVTPTGCSALSSMAVPRGLH